MSWTVDGGPSDGPGLEYGAPSPDELGQPIAESFVLAQTDDVAVWMPAIRGYSTGCVLQIEWRRRRLGEDADTWAAIEAEAFDLMLDYLDDDDGLRISVSTAASTRLPITGSGSMRSDDAGVSGTFELWLPRAQSRRRRTGLLLGSPVRARDPNHTPSRSDRIRGRQRTKRVDLSDRDISLRSPGDVSFACSRDLPRHRSRWTGNALNSLVSTV